MTRSRRASLIVRVLRVGARVLGSVVALVLVCAGLAYLWVSKSEHGREFVRARVVAALAEELAGRIELQEIARLDLHGAQLRGVTLWSPDGTRAATVDSLQAEISPRRLLAGDPSIERLVVRGAYVDLADFSERRGLLAAVAPRKPRPVVIEPASAPLALVVRHIELHDLALDVDVPELGRVGVHALHAALSYRQGAAIEVSLAQLRAGLMLDERPLGAIESAHGVFASEGGPSELSLRAKLGSSRLVLDVQGVAPTDPAFRQAPVSLSATLDSLDAALLELLGQPQLAAQLPQPVRVSLRADGSVAAPQAQLELSARAGQAKLRLALDTERRAQLAVTLVQLDVQQLVPDAPAGKLSLSLTAATESLTAAAPVFVELSVADATFGARALPTLTASGRVSSESVQDLRLSLQGYGGTLKAQGDASAQGRGELRAQLELPSLVELHRAFGQGLSLPQRGAITANTQLAFSPGHVRARVHARVRGLALDGLEARSLDADVSIEGVPSAPRIDATLAASRLRTADASVNALDLRAVGGPRHYQATLRARAQTTALDLSAQVERIKDAWIVGLSARGEHQRVPISARIGHARIASNGELALREVAVTSRGQHAEFSGSYSKRTQRGEVDLRARDLDLAVLGRVLSGAPELRGRAQLELRAQGHLSAPAVELTLALDDAAVAQGPRHSLALDLAVDGESGQAQANVSLHSPAGTELRSHATADLPGDARSSLLERLQGMRYAGTLELIQLEDGYLRAWLADPPPLPQVRASMDARFSGTIAEPEVDATVRALVRDRTRDRALQWVLAPSYAQGEAVLALRASDPDGPRIDASARAVHPEGSTAAMVRDGAELLDRLALEVKASVASRTLGALADALPFVPELGEQERRIEVAGEIAASRAPAAEPNVQLSVTAKQPAGSLASDVCAAQPLELELVARWQEAALRADATLTRTQAPLAKLAAGATVSLASLLSSSSSTPSTSATSTRAALAASIEQVSIDATVDDIDLATLPGLCGRVQGRLAGLLRGQDLLTDSPELQLDVKASALSLHPRHAVDLQARAHATAHALVADVTVSHEGRRSLLSARIPVEMRDGRVDIPEHKPLAASLKLDRFPVAALAPASGPVSRVSGALSAQLELAGSRTLPHVAGVLEAHAIGLTATAIAQPLSGISGRILVQEDRVVIERMVARDGEGSLELSGGAQRDAQGEIDLALKLRAREFPLRQQGRIAGDIDARAAIDVRLAPEQVRVAVALADASLWLRGGDLRKGIALDAHPDILDPRVQAQAPEPKVPQRASIPLNLTLRAQDAFWIRREDFAVRLTTALDVNVEDGDSLIKGRIELRRGYLMLLGHMFDIGERSTIELVGSQPPDPVLDIEATTQNRRSGQRIAVRITGRASAPDLQFSVDGRDEPAAVAAQALFSSESGSDARATTQAQSFVSGLTGGLLGVSLRRELGALMPILIVEPASSGTGSRVRAGFELDDLVPRFLRGVVRGVYLEGMFAGGSEEENRNAQGGVLLEIYLPADLVTSGQYGPGQTWSLDLGWEP